MKAKRNLTIKQILLFEFLSVSKFKVSVWNVSSAHWPSPNVPNEHPPGIYTPGILTHLGAQGAGICFQWLRRGWEILHHMEGVATKTLAVGKLQDII